MIKKISLFCLVLLVHTFVFGQTKGKGSLGFEVGFPQGKGTENVGTGIGGSFKYEGRISSNASFLASFGYLSFPATSNGLPPGITLSGSASFMPITAGLKYYPTEVFNGFYFGGDLGVTVINAKLNISGQGISGSGTGSENKFTFSPGLGYHFSGFDLTIRYNVISDANYIGIRAAVTF